MWFISFKKIYYLLLICVLTIIFDLENEVEYLTYIIRVLDSKPLWLRPRGSRNTVCLLKCYSRLSVLPADCVCPHVVVVVGLERFNDLCGYAAEPLMLDRSKVRFQNKEPVSFLGLRRARLVEFRFLDGSANQT